MNFNMYRFKKIKKKMCHKSYIISEAKFEATAIGRNHSALHIH